MKLPYLIQAAQHGDVDAFGTLVERFQRFAYALAYAQVGDAHLAEDVAQEAFVEAYLHLPRLREPAAFVGWFRRIIFKNGNRLTRSKHVQAVPFDAANDGVAAQHDLVQLVEDRELGQRVRAALSELPEHQRLVMTLFYLAGHDVAEIAALLEVSVSAVKKRLHDARQRLKTRMATMAREYLDGAQPGAKFPLTVQFLITVRTRNLPKIRELLQREPTLVHAREEYDAQTSQQVYLPLSGGFTALHRAAADGDLDLISLLLKAGADVQATSNYGLTPLHNAVAANHPDAVETLLQHGASPHVGLKNGLTPLHWAAMRGYQRIISLLVQHGASPDIADLHGRSPRDWMALKGYTTAEW